MILLSPFKKDCTVVADVEGELPLTLCSPFSSIFFLLSKRGGIMKEFQTSHDEIQKENLSLLITTKIMVYN